MKLDSSQLVLEEDMFVPARVNRFEKVWLLRLNIKNIWDRSRDWFFWGVVWWFGLVVWIPRIPENERDCSIHALSWLMYVHVLSCFWDSFPPLNGVVQSLPHKLMKSNRMFFPSSYVHLVHASTPGSYNIVASAVPWWFVKNLSQEWCRVKRHLQRLKRWPLAVI